MDDARTASQSGSPFVRRDALPSGFADGACDVVSTQHVAMNIADRATFDSKVHRLLRSGGQLAFFDQEL